LRIERSGAPGVNAGVDGAAAGLKSDMGG
jgi:hypothetical protein